MDLVCLIFILLLKLGVCVLICCWFCGMCDQM